MRFRPSWHPVLALFLLASASLAQTVVAPSAPAYPAGVATPLGQQVAAITAEPAVSRAHWGIAVTALDGTPIYGLNEGEFFRPASNNKLFTTAAAMHLLGPGTQLVTSVKMLKHEGTGLQAGVHGDDLLLEGHGDANLSGRTFPYRSPGEHRRLASLAAQQGTTTTTPDPLRYLDELAAEISKLVQHIPGNIIGDDTLWPWEPYANDWSIDDAVWGYGAPVSALTIDDNQLDLTIEPAATVGKAASVKLFPTTDYYQLQADVKTVAAKSPASVRIDRAQGSHIVRVIGTVAVGEPYSTEIAIEDPAEFAAQA
ncbi:MAG: D-alanyl-D-alanine carboxypeptidase, partial [Acidobacteriota bacterium]|nr:D-alanyl-D-alanine carboxypeptidase [Acidobacteriota bacterium]